MDNVRVRFAPSPTGGLHIGGVRTALFNYLFAKKNNGTFILRIEDTDQSRFVEGAEKYILDALAWCGISPEEGVLNEGPYGPYRQSERKPIYKQYAHQLIDQGHAYYAFDTAEDLDVMRERLKTAGLTNPQYDSSVRMTMNNSLTLSAAEVIAKLDLGEPYVIRIKIPAKEDIRFHDMIRGWVLVHGATLDDKVLMKSDGMPTYHLANVVDDYLMKISHVIRGEEWLPSTPLHVLLYKYLGWENDMPKFVHLPLILKPDGNGKLSKRAATKAGFPIFPMSWEMPDGEIPKGFKEEGFLPEALINFLALLGWNPGIEQEIFSIEELSQIFSIERINKSGTKFDIDKAKWFNQQYLKNYDADKIASQIISDLKDKYQIECSKDWALKIFDLLKERVTFPQEFADNCLFLFRDPEIYDEKVTSKKWNEEAVKAVTIFGDALGQQDQITPDEAKTLFFALMEANGIGAGKNLQSLRVAITGEGSGPDLMSIISIMGGKAVNERINFSVKVLGS
jgi:glutamyl-tRNA synthetase